MRRFLALLALLIVVAIPVAVRAGHGGPAHHYRTFGNKAQVVLIDSLTDGWTKTFKKAVAQWNALPEAWYEISIVKGSDRPGVRRECDSPDAPPLRIRVCDYNYYKSEGVGYAGLATTARNGDDHVISATVRMNNGRVPKTSLHTMCHELGHILGLGHRHDENATSCLSNTGGSTPDSHDALALEELYDHSH